MNGLVTQILSTAAIIGQLIILPFLSANTINHLKEKLRTYLAKAFGLASTASLSGGSIDILEWRKNNSIELPNWSQAMQLLFSVQPSSAAAKSFILA